MTNPNRHVVELVEKPFDRWMLVMNTAASIVTTVAIVIAAWFGFKELSAVTQQLEFQTDQIALQRQTLQDEWRQKFFDNQIQIYSEVANVAGKIAALDDQSDEAERSTLTREFLTLYWGKMCIVEGADVERAMILFEKGLRQEQNQSEIQQLALNLVHVCRNETNQRYFLTDAERNERESRFGENGRILKQMESITEANPG